VSGLRVLWIAYDGILVGPGRSQVVPYVEALADRGVRPSLLTWEKPEARHLEDPAVLRRRLRRRGIPWRALPYHRRPTVPATAMDLLHGIVAGAGLARGGLDLVHARSILSAIPGRALARIAGAPWILDTRGFWADERVDGGIWPAEGLLHRAARRIEHAYVRSADGVVTLTRRAAALVTERGIRGPLRVVPTCVDLARFEPAGPGPDEPELAGRRVWLLLGATGTWYLRDAMLDFARDALRSDAEARLVVLSPEHHAELDAGLRARGLRDRSILRAVPHEEVPAWIRAATAAVVFIRPARSKAASCPTKLGEILACGRPVVVNAGIGDVDELVAGRRVGVVLEDPGAGAFDRARGELEALLGESGLAARCRRAAEEELSLPGGVETYLELYREVTR
jgi:glycosyltransferase involved in cell wall biosynthesis